MRSRSFAPTLKITTMTEITISEYSGFCFGVKRAVDMINNSLDTSDKKIFCLGELIHNRIFNDSLRQKGVEFIGKDELLKVPEDALVFLRAHGTTKQIFEALESNGIEYIDATCPYVSKIHKIVDSQPETTKVIVIGDEKHPEVEGIMSWAKGEHVVFSDLDHINSVHSQNFESEEDCILAVQTTYSKAEWERCRNRIKELYKNVRVFETICNVTENRQKKMLELASVSDLSVIVGGRNSSNTAKLFAIASSVCPKAIMIESAKELDEYAESVRSARKIAIAAGASTPSGIIQEVHNKMSDIAREELSFAEMLEQSFKTLNTGERVTGIISAVNPTELKVDLGTKHTGILPYDEVTAESGIDLREVYKVGDEIEVICGKFSDTDGTVLLSKKKLDMHKYWDGIKAAYESGEILSGTVKEIIKNEKGYAGVIVLYGPSKVFIPASQTGVPKGEELESLKGQTVGFKIIDINEQRKRAVGSVKASNKVSRKAAEEEFFANVQEGDKFEGKVRAIMTYGAFVNLGPVDGMLHISELSWGRLKKPSEVLNEGDVISVYIKAIDKEKKRISLGYKTEENDPWNIFAKNYKVGDVVDATIVSLMPFGAFAEIFPDFDGLIHISQIADKPIPNPASVLKIGDKVTVKITAADFENRRLSLSIRALLEDAEPVEEATVEAVEEATEEVVEAAEETAE